MYISILILRVKKLCNEPRKFYPVKNGFYLALALSLLFTTPGLGQSTDHGRIEELFGILKQETGTVLVPAPIVIDQTPAPIMAQTVPALIPAPETETDHSSIKNSNFAVPPVPFSHIIPSGKNCPKKPAIFEGYLHEMTKLVAGYEENILVLSDNFDDLDNEHLEFTISIDVECPKGAGKKHSDFLNKIDKIKIEDEIMNAQNLQLCAQKQVTKLDKRIKKIGQDESLEDQKKRNRLSRFMAIFSSFDKQGTDAVKRMVSIEQKRQRLISGVETFKEDCNEFEMTLDGDYD
jgi:hypothetical protein